LERLGVAKDTTIIWTSDHGEQLWEHRLFTKFVFYESSVHVPFGICGTQISPGERDEFVEHVDLFPTICDLVGVETPGSVRGRSLVSLPDSTAGAAPWRTEVFSELEEHAMIRTADWKLNIYDGRPAELFDMRADPGELTNRIERTSDRPQLTRLLARLDDWRKGGDCPPATS
jgi:choline-sulfatase